MNRERVEKYIKVWLSHIRQEDLEELEKDIEMPFATFVVDMLNNLYNKYSSFISYIPVNLDDYSDYIIAPKNGIYSLEDFLLNRLLRSITWIVYKDNSNTFSPGSHYDYNFGEVLIDKDRMQNELMDVRQRRKVVAHEILHGIKTQFYNGNFFDADIYYYMKEELKIIFGSEINDFDKKNSLPNYDYKHSGFSYSSSIIKRNHDKYGNGDLTNLDEIFNELDAITMSKSDYRVIADIRNNGQCFMTLNNPESSNCWITNYAFILEKLVDPETLFAGLYIEPERFYQEFNLWYSQIFQNCYNSNLDAMEIFIEQIQQIKDDPKNVDRHIKLLDALYSCIDKKYMMTGYNNELRTGNMNRLAYRGLLEISNGRLLPHSTLMYADEYKSIHGIKK